ncbi:MAG: hypothetical protein J0I42_18850 [Bosea sp.]|uniref:hypothetical protein n=1 Tax=Bosea sp. (in: a-proteobacteria) TaxID=1871050 RepID=UPI001AC7ADBC|nr:hypothetical protein [Bosea sp. (in: a-proteobacteria)]MBN9454001.1 hypothetical protein [Bosea sp. (in: a-proteobacteria)]
MNRQDKYRSSSIQNFTQAELDKARDNLAFVKRRFPEESAREQAVIREKGLEDHREVISHYIRFKSPMTERELGVLQMFADTSYAGSFGRGEQHEAAGGSSPADILYRPAIKPDGA